MKNKLSDCIMKKTIRLTQKKLSDWTRIGHLWLQMPRHLFISKRLFQTFADDHHIHTDVSVHELEVTWDSTRHDMEM